MSSTLGERVRRHRIRIGATQEELAHRAGVSVRTIHNLEAGRITAPRLSSMRAICRALAVSQTEFEQLCSQASGADPERSTHAGGLREPLAPMVGRDTERTTLVERLTGGGVRLITLTGIAGIGKTRLALAVTAAVQRLGVPTHWVPLVGVEATDLVVSAVADALGAPEPTIASISDRLPGSTVLLGIDNVEHLDGVDSVIGDLLHELPNVVVLATSRAPLGIDGEHEWPLGPLALPDTPADVGTAPASALLLSRIRTADPGFTLTETDASSVHQVCSLVDGLPLAIELAAGQWRVRGGANVLASIRHDRLSLHGVGPGQVSLRAALDATWALLADQEARALRSLAAFPGGWGLDSALAVVGDATITILDRLLALGLIHRTDTPTGRRFGMLPTIAAFADPRDEDVATMAAWVLRWVVELKLDIVSIKTTQAEVIAERDTIRAALTWFDRHDPDNGLVVASALYHYWCRVHPEEGSRWCLTFADRAGNAVAAATGVRQAAWLARRAGHLAEATELAHRAVRTAVDCGDEAVIATAHKFASQIVGVRDPAAGLAIIRDGLMWAERVGDPELIVAALTQTAIELTNLGERTEALDVLTRAVTIASTHDLLHLRMVGMLNIAHVHNVNGDHAVADAVLTECEPQVLTTGPADAHTYWLAQRAISRVHLGAVDEARDLAATALAGASGKHEHINTIDALAASAEVALTTGDRATADRAYRQVLAIRLGLGSPAPRVEMLAGLAVATADVSTAAVAVAAASIVRTAWGLTPTTKASARLATATQRWFGNPTWRTVMNDVDGSAADALIGGIAAGGC